MTQHAAHAPITEDDAFIAAALERASIPTLMMSLVHLTGDSSLLRGAIRPKLAMMGDVQGGLSDADKAAVRALALEALTRLPRPRRHAAAAAVARRPSAR